MHSFERTITPGFILKFTLPTIVMMVFNSFYTMVDGAFVSNFVGTGALSAINIVYPAVNLIFAIGIMLATGGSAIVAKQMGEGDTQRAKRSFTLIVSFAAGLGAVLAVLGLLFAEPMVIALGANGAILDYCRDYAFYLCLFVPFAMLQLLFQFFFATAGRPNLGLIATVAGGVANLVLDYVFIVPLGMGIKGAAIATGIGFIIPAAIGLVYFSGRRGRLLHFAKPVWEPRTLAGACANGSSEMVSNLSVAVTTFLFNLIMMKLLGEDGVAAMTIVFYAQFLFTAIFLGYTSGVAPLISFNYGADNKKRLAKLVRTSGCFIGVGSVLAYGLSVWLARYVVGVFAAADSAVFELALHGMDLFAVGFLFMGSNIFASGLFTALSNGRVSAILSFLRTFVFIVAAIWLLPELWGVEGVWLSIPMAEFAALVVSAIYVLRLRGRYGY
ncbi:MATE family efflux transporter [Feifania hominis]|uniref:Multidrug export protein MepA n=1 Tax=Feifania hominis TaxID=2763660 RepID=A0A926DFD5_9FIRM|nr:MATE family efflux transporter [Feifania hominis]MBC8536010.1 MATE family efflux transporter [Feifania hominis]